jgi:hypothetical protein
MDDESDYFPLSRHFTLHVLDRYIIAQRYATVFLEASEGCASKKDLRRRYYRVLADNAITPS